MFVKPEFVATQEHGSNHPKNSLLRHKDHRVNPWRLPDFVVVLIIGGE